MLNVVHRPDSVQSRRSLIDVRLANLAKNRALVILGAPCFRTFCVIFENVAKISTKCNKIRPAAKAREARFVDEGIVVAVFWLN